MSESCLVLHVSDTHLGSRQYGLLERENDVYDVFNEIVDIALREHVDLVVHSGDFFDTTRPPMQAVRVAIDGLKKLEEKNIKVAAVLGDHDIPKRREMPPLYLLEHILGNLVVVGKPGREETLYSRVKTAGGSTCVVAGLFSHRGLRSKALRDTISRRLAGRKWDEPSILILHQSLKEAALDYELTLSDLPRGYSYYALGHIHKFMKFNVNGTIAVYPGSPEYLRVDELSSPRVVVLVEVSKRGVVSFNTIRLKSVRPQLVRRIRAENAEEDVKKLLRELVGYANHHKKPLLHVIVEGAVSRSQRQSIRRLLEQVSRHVLDYRVVFEKTPLSSIEAPAIKADTIDLRKLLVDALGDENVAELALKLLTVLGYGGPTEALREAQRVVEEWVKSRYGVEP